jgi:hypothetical protein
MLVLLARWTVKVLLWIVSLKPFIHPNFSLLVYFSWNVYIINERNQLRFSRLLEQATMYTHWLRASIAAEDHLKFVVAVGALHGFVVFAWVEHEYAHCILLTQYRTAQPVAHRVGSLLVSGSPDNGLW